MRWTNGLNQPTTCRRSIFMDVMATCGAQGSCYVKNDGTVPFEGQCNVSTLTPGGREILWEWKAELPKVLLIVPLRLLCLGIYYQLDKYIRLRYLVDLLKNLSLSLSLLYILYLYLLTPPLLFYDTRKLLFANEIDQRKLTWTKALLRWSATGDWVVSVADASRAWGQTPL